MLTLLTCLSVLSLVAASTEIPSSCPSPSAPQDVEGSALPTSFYIDTGMVGDVVFVQADASKVTVAGDCSFEFDTERKRNVLVSSSGCCQVGVPAGGDLDLFVNGDAQRVYLGTLTLGVCFLINVVV